MLRLRPCVPALLAAAAACSQVTPRNERHLLPAPYNFAFYDAHEAAARSFYAAHVAHFGVYEVGLTEGGTAAGAFAELEAEIRRLVEDPPRFEPPAELIAPRWSKIAFPTARAMDWTHMLHSQLYDILTDASVEDRKPTGERAIAYYLANGESAFSTRGYGHRWMTGGGSWAGLFAERYPAVNGILWAYHWHHAAVYEALMEPTPEARRAALDRVVRTFTDSVLVNPPVYMPLTAEVAPRFARMFPAAAHVFDNLHMMHDVVNDVMVDDRLDRRQKAAEIERMRRNMGYLAQDAVTAPGMPMAGSMAGAMPGMPGMQEMPAGHDHGHAMGESAFRVPTLLPDGTWLPQGHPEARVADMEEMMMPLVPGAATTGAHRGHEGHGGPR